MSNTKSTRNESVFICSKVRICDCTGAFEIFNAVPAKAEMSADPVDTIQTHIDATVTLGEAIADNTPTNFDLLTKSKNDEIPEDIKYPTHDEFSESLGKVISIKSKARTSSDDEMLEGQEYIVIDGIRMPLGLMTGLYE